ncbi:schlafen family member 13-like [Saccostrea echinata]|uniref:schlafen family member 13-like n=1 Tax=Saccostrea echinata TaxID=191078 RepID=UPI002A82244D|nr:schlafen family member 13-like [Saccostrea echinata]
MKKIKRQKMSTDHFGLSTHDITSNLHRYGECILHCNIHISRGIHEFDNDIVLRYACGIANSGGGVLHMKNEDYRSGVCSKDLDIWWSGMEIKLAEMISSDDICNYFDMVGNYDDADLYLFIKSAEHICTIDYHSRLPTDTATHEVSYQSVIKLLQRDESGKPLSALPSIPTNFQYGVTNEYLKQETKQIQFKQLSSRNSRDGKGIPDKIRTLISKYVTAFANHEGGHIYFGIDDDQAAVYGEEMTDQEQERTVKLVQLKMDVMIWGSSSFSAQRGVQWDIHFSPVQSVPHKMNPRVVVVVSVCKFPGGVFSATPDSYYVNTKTQTVDCWSFDQWKKAMLNPFRDKPELHGRFIKLPFTVPQAPLVFSLKHTMNSIKAKLFTEKSMKFAQPHHFLTTIDCVDTRSLVCSVVDLFSGGRHLSLFVNCWGLSVPLPSLQKVTCDLFIVSETQGCHLITFATSESNTIWAHTHDVAAHLKYKMVALGGCVSKFGITTHIINVKNFLDVKGDFERRFYPSHFDMSSEKFDNVIDSLIVTMAAYQPVDFTTLNTTTVENILSQDTYFFMLTCDQFQLLFTQQFTKELWVHSPPGAGKTVAAVQFVQELKRRGSQTKEILYLAENELLCSYVRSFKICHVSTRRDFMNASVDTFSDIKNVIVDEAQNFKDRDGDWYSAAERLTKPHESSSQQTTNSNHLERHGFFWVFMDYTQKVHKFNAGLPSIIGKNNFMMSEITRNSKEIFEYAQHFMNGPINVEKMSLADNMEELSNLESSPHLGHEYSSGQSVEILKCDKEHLKEKLFQVLSNIIDSGVSVDDLAVLVGSKQDKPEITVGVMPLTSNHGVEVDTVKEFSGLDRGTIVGVDPKVNPEHADLSKFILSLATRARDKLVIISTSDVVQRKLECDQES